MTLDLLCEIVILLCAFEAAPNLMQHSLLILTESSFVHTIKSFGTDVINVSIVCSHHALLVLVLNSDSASNFLDSSTDMSDDGPLCLGFLLLLFCLNSLWRQ